MTVTLWDLLILLAVAAVIGGLAQALTGFSRGGLLVAIVVGFVGAVVGVWLQHQLGASELFVLQVGDTAVPLGWSIIGGVVFVAVVSLLSPRRRHRRAAY